MVKSTSSCSTQVNTSTTKLNSIKGQQYLEFELSKQPVGKINKSIDIDYEENTIKKYKVYKERWVMLMFGLINELLNCLDRLMLPINTIIYPHWGTDVDQVASWNLIVVTLIAVATLPLGRALDILGVMKMARYQTISMVLGQLLLAATFLDDKSTFGLPISWRFPVALVSMCILIINLISITGFNAKIANDWFPLEQTTLALVIPSIAYNLFGAFASFMAPKIVKDAEDLYLMAYIYTSAAVIYSVAAFTLIRRSKPICPPSEFAVLAAETQVVDLRSGLEKVLKSPRIIMGVLGHNVNLYIFIIQQRLMSDILNSRQYDNEFSGKLIGIGCLFSCLGSLFAAWIDMKATSGAKFIGGKSVKVSRFSAIFYSLTYLTFNWSLLVATNPTIIILTNVISSMGLGLVLPLQLQGILRESKAILPDASMVAINSLAGTLVFYMITGLYLLSKQHFNQIVPVSESSIYFIPLLSFSCLTSIINGFYFIFLSPASSSSSSSLSSSASIPQTQAPQTSPKAAIKTISNRPSFETGNPSQTQTSKNSYQSTNLEISSLAPTSESGQT